MDCSLPGSSVHGIFQARVLEWVAIPFSRQPRGTKVVTVNSAITLVSRMQMSPNTIDTLGNNVSITGISHWLCVMPHTESLVEQKTALSWTEPHRNSPDVPASNTSLLPLFTVCVTSHVDPHVDQLTTTFRQPSSTTFQ